MPLGLRLPTSGSGCPCLPVSGGGGLVLSRLALLSPLFCERAWWWLQFISVQSFSHARLFVTPWIIARQASLSITNSWSLLKLISIELVMPSSRLLLLICVKCINFFQKTSRSDMNWIFSCLPSQLRYLMARTLPAFESLDCNPVSGTELLLINAYYIK